MWYIYPMNLVLLNACLEESRRVLCLQIRLAGTLQVSFQPRGLREDVGESCQSDHATGSNMVSSSCSVCSIWSAEHNQYAQWSTFSRVNRMHSLQSCHAPSSLPWSVYLCSPQMKCDVLSCTISHPKSRSWLWCLCLMSDSWAPVVWCYRVGTCQSVQWPKLFRSELQ